jgi:hypothetical protein
MSLIIAFMDGLSSHTVGEAGAKMIVSHKLMQSNGIGSERLDAPDPFEEECGEGALPVNQSMLDDCFDGETCAPRVVNERDASGPRSFGRPSALPFHGEGFDTDLAKGQFAVSWYGSGNSHTIEVRHHIRVRGPTFRTRIIRIEIMPARPTGGEEEKEQKSQPWLYGIPHSGRILPEFIRAAIRELFAGKCPAIDIEQSIFSTPPPHLLAVGRRLR